MSRPIRDAKDITTGQKVYFKGHAEATYMSDGRTVETAINEAMQGGGSSGGVTADDVYIFEWDGETYSGTLSEAEVAKLWSAKYIVVSVVGVIIPANVIELGDDACYIEATQIGQAEDGSITLQIFNFGIDKNSGEWNFKMRGSVCISANDSKLEELGFYKKPSTGIPESDLSAGVQAMLNEVYVFEWDGEADSGTLSEAELAKLMGAKYVVISHSSGWVAGAIKDNSDDKILILFSQTFSMGIELLVVHSIVWEINKTGEWTMQSDGATFPQITEEVVKELGFATTDEVNTAIQDAVTNALNTAV